MVDIFTSGGPAFPTGGISGMTLRDYFAAKAMQAYLTFPELAWDDDTFKSSARASYAMADAMLKAREQ